MARFVEVARATTFEELAEILPDLELPKGDPVRFELELKLPVASAFDLPAAELLFRERMPPDLKLKDVYSVGARKVVIDCEVDPAWLPAVGAFIAANWKWITLGLIGIGLTLGALIASASCLILAVRIPPEEIPKTLMWSIIGGTVVLTTGIVIYGLTKKS